MQKETEILNDSERDENSVPRATLENQKSDKSDGSVDGSVSEIKKSSGNKEVEKNNSNSDDFEDLIKGPYKDAFAKKVQSIINKRFKEQKNAESGKKILADLVNANETVVLVIPIDSSAPKGRLILPQQQTIRELLDIGAVAVATRETELKTTLDSLKNPPKLVITDSQAFGFVSKVVPKDILLTSFSILFARYKGDLATVVGGAAQLDKLNDGDKVLISEGCTHHRQCKDIGTVKLPGWITDYTGKKIEFEFTSGTEFPEDTSKYALVVHCGGCMLNEKEMQSRILRCKQNGTPITNYGVAIAQMHGILKRSLEPFPQIAELLK